MVNKLISTSSAIMMILLWYLTGLVSRIIFCKFCKSNNYSSRTNLSRRGETAGYNVGLIQEIEFLIEIKVKTFVQIPELILGDKRFVWLRKCLQVVYFVFLRHGAQRQRLSFWKVEVQNSQLRNFVIWSEFIATSKASLLVDVTQRGKCP